MLRDRIKPRPSTVRSTPRARTMTPKQLIDDRINLEAKRLLSPRSTYQLVKKRRSVSPRQPLTDG
jgi:hypothetical protein